MELLFAQHGQATSKDDDPDRPLTDEGREETRRVARSLAAAGVRVDAVWHSGKLRARQTAEIFAEGLAPEPEAEEKAFLGPTDDPAAAVDAARSAEMTVLLVGHKPFMNRLPSLLLSGEAERGVVEVRHSAVTALAEDDGAWTLRWSVRPEVLAEVKSPTANR